MHKSYQPVLPSTNKLLKKKWDDTYYNEHRRLVKTAKPMVDTSAPKQHPHVTSKQKKEQLQRERAEVIDRDNMTLLKKMDSITHRKPGGPGLDHINQYHGKHHSLNLEQRDRTFRRVSKENEVIVTNSLRQATLKRIQQVQPHYRTSQWINDWREKQKLTQLITCYPQGQPTKNTSSMNSVRMSTEENDHKQEQLETTDLLAGSNLQTGGDFKTGTEMTTDELQTCDLQTGSDLQTGEEASGGQPEAPGADMDHKDDQSTDTPKDNQTMNTEE